MFKKVYIEITNVCNLKCKFCPDTKRLKKFMDVNDFESVIKKVHNYTKLVCLHVKGEPLLHYDLVNILKVLDKYKLKTNITTNGTLLKEKENIIKNSKVIRQINISVHAITQNKDLDKDYLLGVLNSVDNLSNIIISFRIWNLKNINEGDINEELIHVLEEYYNIQDLKEKLKKSNYYKIKDNVFINQDMEFSWPNIRSKRIIDKGRCLALKEQIAILVDGTVVPCCLDNDGDICLGNIFDESLEEILNKPFSKLIKNNFLNNVITCNLCHTCGFLARLENKRNK